jgi:catechol 2,3-dioxygenase-like lactoylglutathione lyase family enzyme
MSGTEGDDRHADPRYPQLLQVVLDCIDTRRLAEFYRELLGLRYRPGDEATDPAGDEWLVLRDAAGMNRLAFQQVAALPQSTWPDVDVPQQLHLDLTVPTTAELDLQHERALALGARLVLDRSDDDEEPLRVYSDPAGHPFCIFVV